MTNQDLPARTKEALRVILNREPRDRIAPDLQIIPNNRKIVLQNVKPLERIEPPLTPEPTKKTVLALQDTAEIKADLPVQELALVMPELPQPANEITAGIEMTPRAIENNKMLIPVITNEYVQPAESVLEPTFDPNESKQDAEMLREALTRTFSNEEIAAILAEMAGHFPDAEASPGIDLSEETPPHYEMAQVELRQAEELLPETIQESLLAYVESAHPEQVLAIESFVQQMAAGAARLETLYEQGNTSGEEVVAIETLLTEWYEELLVTLEIPHDAEIIQKFIISLRSIPERATIEDAEQYYDNGMQEQKLGFISLARQLAQALRQKLQFMKLARFVVQASTA